MTNPAIEKLTDLEWKARKSYDGMVYVSASELEKIIAALSDAPDAGMVESLKAENARLAKLVSAAPPAVIEPEIEKLLLRLETPTRENVANGTTIVYTPKPDVLWVCAAYRRLRAALEASERTAFQHGAEKMREMAAGVVDENARDAFDEDTAAAIRALSYGE